MGSIEDAVKLVRAAFEPGADPAVKQQAASLLRSLLAVLESTPGQPLAIAPSSSVPSSSPTLPATSPPDVFDAILAKWKAMLPPDQQPTVTTALRIPFVPIPRLPGSDR